MNVERTRRIQFETAGAETEKDKAMGEKRQLITGSLAKSVNVSQPGLKSQVKINCYEYLNG